MRHAKHMLRLGRSLPGRKSLLRDLVSGLVLHERITTTFTRAKAAQRLAEHLITCGKDGSLHARRQVFSVLQNRTLTKRLFAEVAPLFQDRQGGYTRVVRVNRRRGDGAEMAVVELVAHTVKAAPASTASAKAKALRGAKPAERGKRKEPEREAPQAAASQAAAPETSPAAAPEQPSAPTPQPAKPKKFLEGLRNAWRRKKSDE